MLLQRFLRPSRRQLRQALLTSIALLAVTAGIAPAGPGYINLGWQECEGLPSSLSRNFACHTNFGVHTLFGSFLAPAGVVAATGIEAVLDLASLGVPLPTWWALQAGGCRAGSLSTSFDFTAGPFTCLDYWQGGAMGSHTYFYQFGSPFRARILVQCALPEGDPSIGPIEENIEVYAFKLIVNNRKTVNSGCAGCLTGVCIVFNSLLLTQTPGLGDMNITLPYQRNWVEWQGGFGTLCPVFTPARNPTWGVIKSLYR